MTPQRRLRVRGPAHDDGPSRRAGAGVVAAARLFRAEPRLSPEAAGAA
ncbi:hypothetical protein J2S55_008622 [Streptosporangium brasiliense]|uniref:Uncharacterized protein n=1 Tax=Streptosporangium brasiliense TaxID=47480 RepID=A0ABT9RJ78_9ACTN|nr:hypothetical protein [Streptosporangium brasiliense]